MNCTGLNGEGGKKGGVENIKSEGGGGSPRRLQSPAYHNTSDKCQPPRIKPHSPQLQSPNGVRIGER